MINNVKKLTVKYNQRIVGYLAETEPHVIGFQYDDEWLTDGFSLSPFSLPLREEIFYSKKPFFEGLFGVFWDSLPDGWGELLVIRHLSQQGINYHNLSPLTKLSIIGKNGLGGLSYEPCQNADDYVDNFDLDKISLEVDKVLNDTESVFDLDNIYRLGGSSGGARPKAHVRIDNDEWIIKFPCRLDPVDIGKNEYHANLVACKCGIHVNEFKLFPSKLYDGFFGAKRFDRNGENRVHMISLAAILETTHRTPNLDYIHLFQVIQMICDKQADLYEAFRRMCFNVYYGNKDDHGKNFAFLYDENIKGYTLSPAYDLTRTRYLAEHQMTVNGNGNPTDEDFIFVAKKFGMNIARCKKIIAHIRQIIEKEN